VEIVSQSVVNKERGMPKPLKAEIQHEIVTKYYLLDSFQRLEDFFLP
jgi:hypothetical protein